MTSKKLSIPLKTFCQFMTEATLSEAKVSAKNFDKAIQIFIKLLSRKLGTKFYRFGGKDGIVNVKGGIGVLFFYNVNKAIRFNYVGGEITSITLWDQYQYGKKGDSTISFEGIGLLKAGKKLVDIIAGIAEPDEGKNLFYVNINEDYDDDDDDYDDYDDYDDSSLLISEATISVEKAIELVGNELGRTSGLSKRDIEEVLNSHGYTFPSKLKAYSNSPGRGKPRVFDLSGANPNKDIRAIRVSQGDSQTTSETIPGERQRAKEMSKAAQQIVNEPTEEQIEEMSKKVDTLFYNMVSLVKVVARGARNALLVYGLPGGGKSWLVTKTLNDEGKKRNKDYVILKGSITTAELYRTLFMHRHKNKIIVMDDLDSVFGDKDSNNLLKAALDTTSERYVSWLSRATLNVSAMTDEEREEYNQQVDASLGDPEARIKFPSEFLYEGRVIFISNLNANKIEPAVLNRAASINMDLTHQEMLYRIESILEHLGNKDVPLEKKREILSFIKSDEKTIKAKGLSMRTYIAAEDLYLSGLPNWKDLIRFS